MEPIKRGQLQEEIDEAIVEFLDTGEELKLETKSDSACHFFQKFTVGDDEVQLRVDWSDINDDGHPVLDADFFCSKTRKKRSLKGSRRESHHTHTIPEKGRQYVWSYKNYKRPFKVKVRWLARAEMKVTVVAAAEATVIRSKKS
ncbi:MULTISPECIES: hypothetical protein [Halomonadaceae]|uniref:Uncharacterized protein n=1 Tax=Billgrantia aerodenitrificans TaxID=2733483 RepID=A0ABS9AUD8_9GAMM|nr:MULTISPECIES: hypothetical protein [Halomonas]MCE8025498.1 hypothetical protein [Halomonas aerodenitrificans]MCE8038297.1 hypothetical protein [Halomonas sp. MCCC 1A11062]